MTPDDHRAKSDGRHYGSSITQSTIKLLSLQLQMTAERNQTATIVAMRVTAVATGERLHTDPAPEGLLFKATSDR